MKYFISIIFLAILISCGESPCAKKAREKQEAEIAAKSSATKEVPLASEPLVELTKPIAVNSLRGNAVDTAPIKITQEVCILNKWRGHVLQIGWSKYAEGVYVYTVEYLDSDDALISGDFFDTQIAVGDCSTF